MTDTSIALLQRQAPLECLDVIEDGLGLDGSSPPVTPDDGVPGTKVTGDREPDLGSPRQVRMDVRSEALQQAKLAGVTDRVAARKGTKREVEADGGAPGTQLGDRDPVKQPAFEPQKLLVRGARFVRDGPQAQAGPGPCAPMIGTDAAHRFARTPPPALRWSVVGRHGDESASRPLPRDQRGPLWGPSVARHPLAARIPNFDTLAGPASGPNRGRIAGFEARTRPPSGPVDAWSDTRTSRRGVRIRPAHVGCGAA